MRINPILYGVLVIGVFLGVIFGLRSQGIWSVSGKADAQGNRIAPASDDPQTIKGWMTLGEIAAAYQAPLEEIIRQFELPAGTLPETAIKDLESETFSVSGLREWLAGRLEGGALPPPAVVVTPRAEVLVDPAALPTPSPALPLEGVSGEEEHTPPERRVNARTTFQDLLDWGLSVEAIEQIIGAQMPDPGTVVKDYVTTSGGEFAGVKTALQTAVDQIAP
jgi:hypothetical protein